MRGLERIEADLLNLKFPAVRQQIPFDEVEVDDVSRRQAQIFLVRPSSGTLQKLGFSVRRIADVQVWGSVAEEKLLDRRKAGPFYGRGSLIAVVTEALKPAWETGSAAEVQVAMTAFMAKYLRDLLSHAPYTQTQHSEFRASASAHDDYAFVSIDDAASLCLHWQLDTHANVAIVADHLGRPI